MSDNFEINGPRLGVSRLVCLSAGGAKVWGDTEMRQKNEMKEGIRRGARQKPPFIDNFDMFVVLC